MRVSALANSKWCVEAFEPLYIPFGELDHSCIKEYLVTVAIEVSSLKTSTVYVENLK